MSPAERPADPKVSRVSATALRAGRADSPPLHIPSELCLTGWSIG